MATSSKSEPVGVAQLSARRMRTVRNGVANITLNPAVLHVRKRLDTQQIADSSAQAIQALPAKATSADYPDTSEQTPDIDAIRAEIKDIQRNAG